MAEPLPAFRFNVEVPPPPAYFLLLLLFLFSTTVAVPSLPISFLSSTIPEELTPRPLPKPGMFS